MKTIQLPDTIEIDITQEDIDNGVPGFTECPAALSIRRKLHKLDFDVKRLNVFHHASVVTLDYSSWVYQNPLELIQWIINYDEQSPFNRRNPSIVPATFVLTRRNSHAYRS